MVFSDITNNRKKEDWIKVAVLLFPFIVMSNFTSFSIDDSIYRTLLGTVRIVVCIYYVVKNKDCWSNISQLFYILFFMQLWTFVATFLSYFIYIPIVLFRVLNDTSCVMVIGMLIENYIDRPIDLIKGLMLDYEIAIYSNALSIIKYFPNNLGGRNYYFLEYYTALCLWLIPAIGVAILYIYLNKKYFRGLILIITVFITVFLIKSATTTMAFVFMIIATIIGLFINSNKLFSMKMYSIAIFLASMFIVFVFSEGNFPLIDDFIENILHRDVTFTGRTVIWKLAIDQILERPIFGYGHSAQIEDSVHAWANAAHNEFLQRWFIAGVIGFVLFLIMHYLLADKVDKTKNTLLKATFIGLIVGILTTYTMEAYIDFYRYYVVFFLAYHLDEIVENYKPKEGKR